MSTPNEQHLDRDAEIITFPGTTDQPETEAVHATAERLTDDSVSAGGTVLEGEVLDSTGTRLYSFPKAAPVDHFPTAEEITHVVSGGGALAHPLVTAAPELAGATRPPPRQAVNGSTPVPLGKLNDFHGFPAPAPASLLAWRYSDASGFEAQRRLAKGVVVIPPLGATTTSCSATGFPSSPTPTSSTPSPAVASTSASGSC